MLNRVISLFTRPRVACPNVTRCSVNLAVDPIITRWKRSDLGAIMLRDGKQVLEVILVYRKDEGVWSYPGI